LPEQVAKARESKVHDVAADKAALWDQVFFFSSLLLSSLELSDTNVYEP